MFSLISRRSTVLAGRTSASLRALSTSSVVRAERSEMSNQDPAVLEREKQAHLKGEDKNQPHPEHAPKWNESLASESEANVKADNANPSGPPSEQLQKKTVEHVQEVHHKK